MVMMPSGVDAAPLFACAGCAAPLGHDQRYCVDCGTRHGPLPEEVRWLIGALAADGASAASGSFAIGAGAAGVQGVGGGASPSTPPGRPAATVLPGPRTAALAAMFTLAFGVAVGRAATPAGHGDYRGALLAALAPSFVAASGLGRAAAVAAPAAPSSPTPAPSPPAPTPAAAPAAAPAPPAPTPTTKAKPAPAAPPAAPATPTPPPLPAVKHVFLIVLSDHGVDAAFGPGSAAPYLATMLRAQGELLPNYYAVAGGELANAIALVSGQGPTPQTVVDCPQYADLLPGTVGDQGQAVGGGCIYPAAVKTLPDELAAGAQGWRAYVEAVGSGGPGTAATCRHPAPGGADPGQPASPTDRYVTWRNPFVYFHSLVDGSACTTNDVGLDRLTPDLATAKTAPSFAYIVPDRCHDASETPCAPGQPAGLPAADAFLRTVVPEIVSSAAYQDGGLIAITFDQAPQTGPGADASACCHTPTSYPSLAPGAAPPPATPTVAAPTTPTTPTTPTVTTVTTPTGTPPYALPIPTATATTPPPYALPIPTATTTTPTTTTPAVGPAAAPSTFPVAKGVTSTGGGGRVGLLLISSFVKPGSVNPAPWSHYSLLASLQDLFGLPRIGYAGVSGLPVFDATVYNAKPMPGPSKP